MFFTIIVAILAAIIIFNIIPRKKKSVSGQICLITGIQLQMHKKSTFKGAGSGLGRLLSLRFGKLGCKLVLLDINSVGLEKVAKEVAEETGASVKTYVVDVSDKDRVAQLVQDVKKDVGKVIQSNTYEDFKFTQRLTFS
jgi:all-trans-retinol dehydrogenase (NAD+)